MKWFRYCACLCSLYLGLILAVPGHAAAAEPSKANAAQTAENQGQAGKPRITVSHETTFVTKPLTKDGYVDYIAAINQHCGKDIQPQQNAAILLWQIGHDAKLPPGYQAALYRAWGLKPPEADQQLLVPLNEVPANRGLGEEPLREQQSQAVSAPWKASDLPAVAAWLQANEAALAKAHEAARRAKYFFPLVDEGDGIVMSARLPGSQASREVARALTARAMLRLQAEEYDAAWNDLLAAACLGRLVRQSPSLVPGMMGIALDGLAIRGIKQYLQHAPLTAEQALARRQELENLPPGVSFAEKLQFAERLTWLDGLTHLARGSLEMDALTDPHPKQTPTRIVMNMIRNRTDWNVVLRTFNADLNEYLKLLKVDNHATRYVEMDNFSKRPLESLDPTRLLVDIGEEKDVGETLGKHMAKRMLVMLTPAMTAAVAAEAKCEQEWASVDLGFALAAYRAQHGRFPPNLQALQPGFVKELPRDAFSGKPLTYKPAGGGYVLYSIGLNGQDDGGVTSTDAAGTRADDLVLRISKPMRDH